MLCPYHDDVHMRHFPGDGFRQWECPRCGSMFTDEFVGKLDSAKILRMREDMDSLRSFQRQRNFDMMRESAKAIQSHAMNLLEQRSTKKAEESKDSMKRFFQ